MLVIGPNVSMHHDDALPSIFYLKRLANVYCALCALLPFLQ